MHVHLYYIDEASVQSPLCPEYSRRIFAGYSRRDHITPDLKAPSLSFGALEDRSWSVFTRPLTSSAHRTCMYKSLCTPTRRQDTSPEINNCWLLMPELNRPQDRAVFSVLPGRFLWNKDPQRLFCV